MVGAVDQGPLLHGVNAEAEEEEELDEVERAEGFEHALVAGGEDAPQQEEGQGEPDARAFFGELLVRGKALFVIGSTRQPFVVCWLVVGGLRFVCVE